MVFVAISLIAGIAAFRFFPFFPVTIPVVCSVACALLFIRRRRPAHRTLFIIALVFVFGFLYSAARYTDLTELILPGNDVEVEGVIDGTPVVSHERLRVDLDGINLEGHAIHGKVRLFLSPELYMLRPEESVFSYRDRVRALVRLKTPHSLRNPGVYAYDSKKDGIVAIGYAKKLRVLSKGSGALNWISVQRQRLGRIMENSLSEENAAFIKAIIPGFKSGISQQMRDAFGATGLAHLLSISGTHFGLLAFIVFILIKSAMKLLPLKVLSRMALHVTPTQVAVLVTLPVLVLYALISGGSAPTIRSLIMVLIYMLALFLGRRGQWKNSLSIAAVIILVREPAALFELSFILSFLAVFSIGTVLDLMPELSNKELVNKEQDTSNIKLVIERIFGKLKTAPLLTIAAVAGTVPVAALVFKHIPLISPLTNLIITPLVCFVILPIGFFSGFCALAFDMSVMPFNGLADAVTGFTLRLIESVSRFPYANVHVHNPSFALIILYYLSLLYLVQSSRKSTVSEDGAVHLLGSIDAELRLLGNNGMKRITLRFLPFLIVVCIYLCAPYLKDEGFSITFLDVGQGDASVVRLPDGKVMLIDGSTQKPDMGRMVVGPYLWSMGIRKVDYMVLSHPHPDHYGGLSYIMDNFDIGEVWGNGRIYEDATGFFSMIQNRAIKYKVLERGDSWEAEKYQVDVFHPYDKFNSTSSRGVHSGQNNDSLVLKIESEGVSVLYTGDIEKETEGNLIHLGSRLKSDILKVPHHGSRTSSSVGFLEMVSPQIAVANMGMNNRFGHPHREIIERYGNKGVKMYRTDRDGAVSIYAKNGVVRVVTYEHRTFRRVLAPEDEINNLRLLFMM